MDEWQGWNLTSLPISVCLSTCLSKWSRSIAYVQDNPDSNFPAMISNYQCYIILAVLGLTPGSPVISEWHLKPPLQIDLRLKSVYVQLWELLNSGCPCFAPSACAPQLRRRQVLKMLKASGFDTKAALWTIKRRSRLEMVVSNPTAPRVPRMPLFSLK